MLFTKFDFEDKWGNPCNPTTAAQIANEKTKNLVAAEDVQPLVDAIKLICSELIKAKPPSITEETHPNAGYYVAQRSLKEFMKKHQGLIA